VKVYGDVYSGNCFKVKLLLSHLALPHEWVHVDILKKETRTPEFLAKNPNGKIPLIEIEPGTFLSESSAILAYLAEGTSFLPKDRLERARVFQWMSFEQYSHEPYIATARFIIRYLGRPSRLEESLQQKMAPGYQALDVMEQHLTSRAFFVAERYTIADIALYAYTHVAQEGGFDLSKYSGIASWMVRVQSQTGYVGMDS
jgi:glutathione S-transferase